VDISAEMWVTEQRRSGWRSTGRSSKNTGVSAGRGSMDILSRRKPLTVSGPYVVYMLSDEDILEDWTAIKKALSVCKRKNECKLE